jgi:hypothetical protein
MVSSCGVEIGAGYECVGCFERIKKLRTGLDAARRRL